MASHTLHGYAFEKWEQAVRTTCNCVAQGAEHRSRIHAWSNLVLCSNLAQRFSRNCRYNCTTGRILGLSLDVIEAPFREGGPPGSARRVASCDSRSQNKKASNRSYPRSLQLLRLGLCLHLDAVRGFDQYDCSGSVRRGCRILLHSMDRSISVRVP